MKTSFLQTGISTAALSLSAVAAFAADGRPNILYIMSDDHSFQTIGVYASVLKDYVKTPNIDRIANEGVKMENCFVTNSISTPSRAAILTGQYSHHNQVYTLADELPAGHPSMAKELQKNGYQTAIVGKWHIGTQPEGFDFYSVMPGQGKYENPGFMESGLPFDVKHAVRTKGYCTDVITDKCIDWMEQTDKNKPFFLMCHFKAPHTPFTPAERHKDLYKGVVFPEPDNLYENLDSRPILKSVHNKISGGRFANKELPKEDRVKDAYQEYIRTYLSCIAGIDENVGRLLDYLEKNGQLNNTIIVYTSDQGFYMGEHGWFDKRFMYEESMRTPLIMRLPKGFDRRGDITEMVQNIDYAPTFLELAGVEIPSDIQGVSLVPLLKGKQPENWRKALYYHFYEYPAEHMVKRHYGVRTDPYKLIHFYNDIDAWELYDLEKDPAEMHNVINDPAYSEVLADMQAELKKLQIQYNDTDFVK